MDFVMRSEGKSENWASMGVKLFEKTGSHGGAIQFLGQAVNTAPNAIGPRLVMVRRLLGDGHVLEAHRHLLILSDQGIAEAAFYLGVYYIHQGQLKRALGSMELALALNPGHKDTEEQINNLKMAIADL